MSERKRIPLIVCGAPDVAYTSWPVTIGIPFADGELERLRPVRIVDEAGHAIPTQSKCLATWNKDIKYVRWLLVDFQYDLPAETTTQEIYLEYGDSTEPPAHGHPVTIENLASEIRIATGLMEVGFRTSFEPWKRPYTRNAFTDWRVKHGDDWRRIIHGNTGPFLYMEDQQGTWYDSVSAGPPPQVTIEESGPLRSCIRINGYYTAPGGQIFCPYILRMHFFAGKSDVRILNTFVFNQDPHAIELKAIGLNVPLDVGDKMRAAVGGTLQAHWASNWRRMQFLQSNDEEYSVSLDGQQFGNGARTNGWASLNGNDSGVVAVIKDCRQEYPKGFILTSNGIDIQIWPDTYFEPLRFTTPFEEPALQFNGTRDEEEFKRLLAQHPTAPLSIKSFNPRTEDDVDWIIKMIEKYAPARTASLNDTGTDNGVGAAKTTEISLRLNAQRVDDDVAEAFARMVQEPLTAPADPEYTCGTGAVSGIYHSHDPRFRGVNIGLDDLFRMVAIEPRERCHLYGMMRHGNMVCSHSIAPSFWYTRYRENEPKKALEYTGPYNNESNDQIMAVWGNFIRTGSREHFLLAQAYSRNVADVGIIHDHPAKPENVGLMHYHNAHQWSGSPSPSHTLVSGLLMDYYFTGNQRLLDVSLEVADRLVGTQEPCGIISNRNGRLPREFANPLLCLMQVYEATWIEKYGGLAQRSLNWYLRALPGPGRYLYSVFTRGDRGDEAVVEPEIAILNSASDDYSLFAAAIRLFDSKVVRDYIIAYADYWLWKGFTDSFVTEEMVQILPFPIKKLWKVDEEFYWVRPSTASGGFNLPMVCLAYELTGDMMYAAFCKDHIEGFFLRVVKRARRFADWQFHWLMFGSYIPRMMKTVAEAMDRDAQKLADAEAEWREKRAQVGLPVYVGPGVDFTKDRMDAGGNITNRPPDMTHEGLPPDCNRWFKPGTPPERSLGRLSTAPHPPAANPG